MTDEIFKGEFTRQEPIPEAAIEQAVAVMRTGRLHRYNTAPGERSETEALEAEFAAWQGAPYCLACASGGYALHVALKAWGMEPGEPVLTNAFTLSPVPGAIANAGGKPVFVEVTEDLVLDLDHLLERIEATGARVLMLSHMRGHLVDMDKLADLTEAHGVAVIEDCAHTMGAAWAGRRSGNFGVAACFSTQTYKHINSGEGGLLTTSDPDLMARAVLMSGSYMLYDRHGAAPDREAFDQHRWNMPNCSGRMDNLRAAILRPQLSALDDQVARWSERYQAVEAALAAANGITTPRRPQAERFVGSSIQFLTQGFDAARARNLVDACKAAGVELKWFGAEEPAGYTSRHDSWRYTDRQDLPRTDAILSQLFDMRIPLTFSIEDCRLIGRIIAARHAEISTTGIAA